MVRIAFSVFEISILERDQSSFSINIKHVLNVINLKRAFSFSHIFYVLKIKEERSFCKDFHILKIEEERSCQIVIFTKIHLSSF